MLTSLFSLCPEDACTECRIFNRDFCRAADKVSGPDEPEEREPNNPQPFLTIPGRSETFGGCFLQPRPDADPDAGPGDRGHQRMVEDLQ